MKGFAVFADKYGTFSLFDQEAEGEEEGEQGREEEEVWHTGVEAGKQADESREGQAFQA